MDLPTSGLFWTSKSQKRATNIQERIKDKIVLNPNSIIPKIEQSRKLFLITKWRETNIKGDSLVLHCASLTAHNRMASVKKSMWGNIIKMKLTEEKCYCNLCLWVVSCRGETQCGGNVHNVSSTRVAEFDFLTENLDSGCLICAYSLRFSFKCFLYHIVS